MWKFLSLLVLLIVAQQAPAQAKKKPVKKPEPKSVAMSSDKTPQQWLDEEAKYSKELTEGEKLYVEAVQKPEPLPSFAAPGVRPGIVGFYIGEMKVLDRVDMNSGHVKLGNEVCLLKSFIWRVVGPGVQGIGSSGQLIAVLAGEAGSSAQDARVIELVRPSSNDIKAALAAREFTRRRHTFSGVGDVFFVQLVGGKAKFVKIDGEHVEVPTSSLSKEDTEWIRKFGVDEKKLHDARELEKKISDKAEDYFRRFMRNQEQ